MNIAGKAVLVTGANRGIGKALVEEALNRGASRVYAGTRGPLTHSDERVTPVTLDVTDAAQIKAAVEQVESLDVLINNAGIVAVDDLSDRALIDKMMAVNFYGVYDVVQAFLPLLSVNGGAIVNNISVNAFAAFPLVAAYSTSKAAAFNLTQSLRTLLEPKGISVHAVLTGLVDTDMTAGFDIPKAPPSLVAQGVFDGVEKGDEDIFPDPMAEPLADGWRNGPGKGLEKQYAAMFAQLTGGGQG
jgi:NAD(P)-dependent dehydrogenase (short-subunit alcohol dehydrogenase family)